MHNWKPGVRGKSVQRSGSPLMRLVVAIAATLKLDVNTLAKNMRTKEARAYAGSLVEALDGQIKATYESAVKALTKKK